jgi:hypothetical protein
LTPQRQQHQDFWWWLSNEIIKRRSPDVFHLKNESPGAKGVSMGWLQRSAISRKTLEPRPEFENLSDKCDKKTVGDDD